MAEKISISVIIPLYNEKESLEELYAWLTKVMEQQHYTYEIIFIDDGSTDGSWEVIEDLYKKNQRIKGIQFNKNHGKSAALNTGFRYCEGEVVVTLDADLQDSPDEIPALYKMIKEEGYTLVSGKKKARKDPVSKIWPSKLFNYVTRKITRIPLYDFNCGLKAYQLAVVKSLHIYGEMHRFIPVIAQWNGFTKIGEKEVVHYARKYGKTKFGMERFVHGFLDLVSVIFVTKFKKKPMHFFGSLGVFSFITGFVITVTLIVQKLYHLYYHLPVRDVVDQPLFFLALVALIIGVQLFLTGFLGEMFVMHMAKKDDYLIAKVVGIE